MKEVLKHPHGDGQEVKSQSESLVSREEEERHEKMLAENEQLKKQIAEVGAFRVARSPPTFNQLDKSGNIWVRMKPHKRVILTLKLLMVPFCGVRRFL